MNDLHFPDILKRLLESTGSRTDAELAAALGISAQSVSQARKKGQIPPQWYVKVYQGYGASMDWLLTGNGAKKITPPFPPAEYSPAFSPAVPGAAGFPSAAQETPEYEPSREGGFVRVASPASSEKDAFFASPLHEVPVLGLAACGVEGWFNPDALAFRLPLPAGHNFTPDLFAVIAVGTSMQPEGIRQGYVLFCDPQAELRPGDAVFIERLDGKASVKKFIRHEEEWLVLQGWLPPSGEEGAQKPYTERVGKEYVKKTACVVNVKRKA